MSTITIPDELLQELRKGSCVLFVGEAWPGVEHVENYLAHKLMDRA